MAKKCVILNGPPGCGKDTIAKLLVEQADFSQCENKESIFDIAIAMTGLSREEWFARYRDRELKEKPWDRIKGYSQRALLIYISEECVKPYLGKAWIGKLAAEAAYNKPGNAVFSDGGFQEEMGELQQKFGKENVLLVQLFRPGFSFDGDSRNYLKPNGSPCLPLQLIPGLPDAAVTEILTALAAPGESFEF